MVVKWGFVDVFENALQGGWACTFWDYRLPNSFKRNLGWRLDHIMATMHSACYIDKEPGCNPAAVFVGRQILFNNVADKVGGYRHFDIHHQRFSRYLFIS